MGCEAGRLSGDFCPLKEEAEQGIWPTLAALGYRNMAGPDGKRIIEPDPETAANYPPAIRVVCLGVPLAAGNY